MECRVWVIDVIVKYSARMFFMETLPSTMDAFEQNEPPAPPAPFEDVPCHSHAPPSWHLYRKQGSRRSRLNEAFSKELPRGEHLTVESTPLIPHLIPHLLELPFDTGLWFFLCWLVEVIGIGGVHLSCCEASTTKASCYR